MYRKVALLIMLMAFFCTAPLKAQYSLSAVDQRTFALWQAQNWKDLIREGEDALHHGIDFYYLRVRLGIAFYERHNYHEAIRHLEKARSFNNTEPYVNEYLYYALQSAGRMQEAEKLARAFRDLLAPGPHIHKQAFIRKLELSYNFEASGNKTTADNYVANVDSLTLGSQYVPNTRHSFRLGFTHVLSPSFVLHHGYTYVNQQYFFYRQRDTIRTSNEDYATNVHQYFISGQVRLAKNWYLTPGLHYLGVRYPAPVAFAGAGPRGQRSSAFTNHQLALYLHLTKIFPYVSPEVSLYYANLNAASQLQTDVLLHTFPLGNLNLYTESKFSVQWETADGRTQTRLALAQRVGGKVCKHLWLDGFVAFGQMQNFLSNYGTQVYNGAGAIRLYGGSTLTFPVGKKLRIQASYAYLARESYFVPESAEDYNVYNVIATKNHSITGGLVWDFSKPLRY